MKKVVLKHKTWFLLTVIMKVIAGVAYVMVPLLITSAFLVELLAIAAEKSELVVIMELL